MRYKKAMKNDYLERINSVVLSEEQEKLTQSLADAFVEAFNLAKRRRFRGLLLSSTGPGGSTTRDLEDRCEEQSAREVLEQVAEAVFSGKWTPRLRKRVAERVVRWRMERNWV